MQRNSRPGRVNEFDCSAAGNGRPAGRRRRCHTQGTGGLDEAEGHFAREIAGDRRRIFATADAEFTQALRATRNPRIDLHIGDYAVKRGQPERLAAVVKAGERAAPTTHEENFYGAVGLILKKRSLKSGTALQNI